MPAMELLRNIIMISGCQNAMNYNVFVSLYLKVTTHHIWCIWLHHWGGERVSGLGNWRDSCGIGVKTQITAVKRSDVYSSYCLFPGKDTDFFNRSTVILWNVTLLWFLISNCPLYCHSSRITLLRYMHVIDIVAVLAGIPQRNVLLDCRHGDTHVFLTFNI